MPPPRQTIRALRRLVVRKAPRPVVGAVYTARIARAHRTLCHVRQTREGDWVHRYRGGVTIHPRPRVGPTIRQLEVRARDYFLQEYEPREGDTVVDVGAGVGDEVHLFSQLVGQDGHVFAIEAHPSTYEVLERRCRLSRATNVHPVHLAITDRSGGITISDTPRHIANSVVSGGADGIAVAAQTLDDFVSARGITRIDFLKMNIEGAERHAVAGMAATIAMTRNVCICCHDFLADETGVDEMRTKADVRAFLEEQGFEVMERRPDDRRPWSRDYLYGRRRQAVAAAASTVARSPVQPG